MSGDGPAFHRFGNRVRYRRPDLDAWAARRRATTTAEAYRLRSGARGGLSVAVEYLSTRVSDGGEPPDTGTPILAGGPIRCGC